MKPADNIVLAASTDTGSTGIYQLKRLWSKSIAGQDIVNQYPEETGLDNALIDILGLGLLPTYQYLYGQKPNFENFEKWVITHAGGHLTEDTIQQCNALFQNKNTHLQNNTADVLTPDDIIFWETHGYVIIKNVVSPQDCAASRKAIMDYLEMDEADETTWYKESGAMQGIMVSLYRNAVIDKNRNSPKIKSVALA